MRSYHQEVATVSLKVKSFLEKAFSSVSVDGPEIDAETLSSTPLMLISSHRSHVDYFLVGDLFHLIGFKNLRFAAGDNLTNLPWIGPKFKAFGAFAIERDTGFDRNYVKNLCYNVVSMIEQGDTVLVFPEGGRSYSGAMLDMRIGVLGASILSQANTPERDVNYIPITVSYENAPDIPWFDMQQKGKKWRKHSNSLPKRLIGNVLYYGADLCSFLPFMLSPYFKRKYGNAYVDYGAPISIRSLIDVSAKTENARDDFSAHRDSMLKIGTIVREQLVKLYRILPMHVVAAQLKEQNNRSISELSNVFPEIIVHLKTLGYNVKQLEEKTPAENALTGIRQLRKIKAITIRRKICSIKRLSLINYYAATLG